MYNFHMQEPLESTEKVIQLSDEVDAQAEVRRLQQLINDFLSKFQLALKRDEQGEVIRDRVSAELSDIFNILDRKLLLNIAEVTETHSSPEENFLDYVQYTVTLRKERQEKNIEELDDREFYSQRIAQAFDLAKILYPQNISETPKEIDARDMLLRLGLTISEQVTTEDITKYYYSLIDLMDELIVITRYQGTTTYSLPDPSIPSENKGKMYNLEKALDDLEVLVPVFQSNQDTILAINNSVLEEKEKKALLFLLSSPYKQDLTNRNNWPNGFVRYYDENSEWLTKYLNGQLVQTHGDAH